MFVLVEPEGTLPVVEEQSSEEVCVTVGEQAVLDVKASGYPVPVAKWLKGSDELESNANIEIVTKDNQHKLILKSVTLEDDDDFYCQLVNDHGTAEAIFSVIVEEEKVKPEFLEGLVDQEVVEGEEVEFSALVESTPEALVQWQLNDQTLTDGEGFQILVEDGQSHVLIIDGCELEDTGVVKCIAKNEGGEAISEAKLTVNAKGMLYIGSVLRNGCNKAIIRIMYKNIFKFQNFIFYWFYYFRSDPRIQSDITRSVNGQRRKTVETHCRDF